MLESKMKKKVFRKHFILKIAQHNVTAKQLFTIFYDILSLVTERSQSQKIMHASPKQTQNCLVSPGSSPQPRQP